MMNRVILVGIMLFGIAGLVDAQLWPTPTPPGGTIWDTPTPAPTRTPTNTRPPATPTPRAVLPTPTPIPTMTPTPTPVVFPCEQEAAFNVTSTEGVPYAFEWYFAPGCGQYPIHLQSVDCVGMTCSMPLNFPQECMTYLGRYWHEIAPGLDYVDTQYFQIETTCIAVFIFGDGFEDGTTDQWSKTITN